MCTDEKTVHFLVFSDLCCFWLVDTLPEHDLLLLTSA